MRSETFWELKVNNRSVCVFHDHKHAAEVQALISRHSADDSVCQIHPKTVVWKAITSDKTE